MQFQVPQFIDVEDKAIGPLTIKQFLYILMAGIVLLIIFRIFNFFVFFILAIPIAGLTYALAFLKVHNQPFIKVAKNFLGFLKKPDFYVWKKSIKKTSGEEKGAPELIKKTSPKKKVKPKFKERLQEIGWKVEIEKE